MSKFSCVNLGDIIEIASGQVDPTAEPYCDLPHVGGDNIESGTGNISGVRSASELRLISGKYEFDQHDILYSKIRPNLNKVALPDFHGICSADIYPIRPRDGKADRRYLAHALRSGAFLTYATKHSTRTNIPKINRDALLSFSLALPPLSEQLRIANILDKADALRRKCQKARAQAADLSLSLFAETFQKCLTPQSERVQLGELAAVASGVAKGRALNGDSVREVPYLRVANVQAGYLDLTELKTIPAVPSEIETLALQPGDVVMTEGGDHDKLGRGALWEKHIPDCIHQNHIFRVRANRDRILPSYFVHFLQTQSAKSYFLKCAKKTTNLATINMRQLRALPVPVPPLPLQQKYERELAALRRLTDRNTDAIRESEDLFNCLVQRAFREEL